MPTCAESFDNSKQSGYAGQTKPVFHKKAKVKLGSFRGVLLSTMLTDSCLDHEKGLH